MPPQIEMPELRDGAEIPEEYLCPISQDIMLNPVICMDGQTYDRISITRWLETKSVSPHTNQRMEKTLIPNYAMKNIIEKWLNENKK